MTSTLSDSLSKNLIDDITIHILYILHYVHIKINHKRESVIDVLSNVVHA